MKLVYEISNVVLKDPQIRKQYTKNQQQLKVNQNHINLYPKHLKIENNFPKYLNC